MLSCCLEQPARLGDADTKHINPSCRVPKATAVPSCIEFMKHANCALRLPCCTGWWEEVHGRVPTMPAQAMQPVAQVVRAAYQHQAPGQAQVPQAALQLSLLALLHAHRAIL